MAKIQSLGPVEKRDDFRPVIIGGDIGSYAVGRELFEAFGVRSYCIAPEPVNAISRSSIFDTVPVARMDAPHILEAIRELVRKEGGCRLLVTSNMDIHVENISKIEGDLPELAVPLIAPAAAIDAINYKETFTELALKHGLRVPRTQAVALDGSSCEPWDGEFPVVVKAASSVEYVPVRFKGFDKVYLLDSQEAVDDLFRRLREAGFTGTMLVQQVVVGDDTYKRSLTLYFDRNGRLTLSTGAQVLLEDHMPNMIGNPVTMVTRDLGLDSGPVIDLLQDVGWRGPANYDLKVDARTGETYVFECNPRLGRNSYYVAASAVNPMYLAVKDLLDGEDLPLHTHRQTALYSVVPTGLALRYLDGELLDEARSLIRAGRCVNPTKASFERNPVRSLVETAVGLNFYRKYAEYYPHKTDLGI